MFLFGIGPEKYRKYPYFGLMFLGKDTFFTKIKFLYKEQYLPVSR
jgi:hypothetical protein